MPFDFKSKNQSGVTLMKYLGVQFVIRTAKVVKILLHYVSVITYYDREYIK